MIDGDDPFGIGQDHGRTRIRPPPPSAQAPYPAADPARRATAPATIRGREHPNPLIGAFAGLLAVAPELEAATAPADPEHLRAQLLDGLVRARDAATAAGIPVNRANEAAWAVAALLDDLALNTPWGGASAWPRQPLVSTLFGDVDAGARFFDRLEELERHPARDPQMLEFLATCLALGFRGKYRVPGRAGDRSMAAVRTAAARLVRAPEAEAAPLSPNWQGAAVPDRVRRGGVPVWAMFAVATAAAAAVYLLLMLRLDGQAEQLVAVAERLPPPEQALIVRPERTFANPIRVASATEAPDFALVPAFIAAVPQGLRPALRDPQETNSLATLVVQWADPELFRSARADLTSGFEPLFSAVGAVIAENADLIGTVTVIGHTDSVPLNATNPFASNDRLSLARAETVRALLLASGVPPDMIRAEGRGDREPVASNADRASRALNRRIEVLVEKRL